ncbi:MAG: tetratricopeptide repeat protein [Planctomycetota bacterium]|nr:tetratricopeptide repeat protein [Planctomycetota bacterium]
MRGMALLLAAWAALLAPPARSAEAAGDAELEFWRQRVDRDPEDFKTPGRLCALYLQAGKERGEDGFFKQAEEAARIALKRNPRYYGGLLLLAGALSAQHRFQAAAAAAGEAAKLEPATPDAYGALGDARMEYGDLEGAAEAYARFERGAHPFERAARRANFAFASGRLRDALRELEKALKIAHEEALPHGPQAWCHVRAAEFERLRGRYEEAQEHCAAALRFVPGDLAALIERSKVNLARGAHAEAVADAQAVVARRAHPELVEFLAEACEAAGLKDEARAAWARAKELYAEAAASDNPHDYRNLARYLAGPGGDPGRAADFARKDLELRKDAYAWDALAWALHRGGKAKEAAEALRHALERLPEDPELLDRAGQILLAAGEAEAGRKLLKRALDLNKHYPGRARIEALLEK